MKLFFLLLLLSTINISLGDDEYDPTSDPAYDKIFCENSDSSEPCQSRILTGGRLCCDIHEETADETQESCEVKTTLEEQKRIVGSSEVINKELGGLQIYNSKYGGVAGSTVEERKDDIRRTITITCSSWSYSVNIIDDHEYTTEDIAILQSDNHCLSYFTPILMHISSNRRSVSRSTCNNALLLTSTKEQGISCGYMEIDIQESHNIVEKRKTCFLYDRYMEIDIQESHNIVEKRKTCFLYDPNVKNNKVLDEATRLNLNALSKKAEDNSINYSFKIYPADGNGYSYDSKTGTVQDATYKESKGNIISMNINGIFLITFLLL